MWVVAAVGCTDGRDPSGEDPQLLDSFVVSGTKALVTASASGERQMRIGELLWSVEETSDEWTPPSAGQRVEVAEVPTLAQPDDSLLVSLGSTSVAGRYTLNYALDAGGEDDARFVSEAGPSLDDQLSAFLQWSGNPLSHPTPRELIVAWNEEVHQAGGDRLDGPIQTAFEEFVEEHREELLGD